jgi:large subunit ribosomal protein L17
MRHRRKSKHFSRKTTAFKALFRGLIISMVEHGRITTTVEKAKELRRHIEKAITLGKKDDLAARRLLLSRIPHPATVDAIMTDIAPRFKTRNGGYTRIIKIGRRPGDTAEMAFIEFVDHDWSKAHVADEVAEKAVKGAKAAKDSKEATKAAKAAKPKKASAVVAKKKTAVKKQKKARAAARA